MKIHLIIVWLTFLVKAVEIHKLKLKNSLKKCTEKCNLNGFRSELEVVSVENNFIKIKAETFKSKKMFSYPTICWSCYETCRIIKNIENIENLISVQTVIGEKSFRILKKATKGYLGVYCIDAETEKFYIVTENDTLFPRYNFIEITLNEEQSIGDKILNRIFSSPNTSTLFYFFTLSENSTTFEISEVIDFNTILSTTHGYRNHTLILLPVILMFFVGTLTYKLLKRSPKSKISNLYQNISKGFNNEMRTVISSENFVESTIQVPCNSSLIHDEDNISLNENNE